MLIRKLSRRFWGVAQARGEAGSPLYGRSMRPFFWPRPPKRCFRAAEPLSPDCRPHLPHPSWATTKEKTAWVYGA